MASAGLFPFLVAVVAAAWELSTLLVPFMFLVFLAGYAWLYRDARDWLSVLISSQRELTLQYGLYLVAGTFIGATVAVVWGAAPVAGAVIAVGIGLYGVSAEPVPEPVPLRFDWWQEAVYLSWLVVPLLALVAVVSHSLLLQSAVTLIFYAAVFWEV